jgi:hypothetical protein
MYHAESFPDIPIAEKYQEGPDEQAEFVFIYDFACGALSSLRARMKYMNDNNIAIPDSVKSWAMHSKFLVDKFHFKTHVGMPRYNCPDRLSKFRPYIYPDPRAGKVCHKSCHPWKVTESVGDKNKAAPRKLMDYVNSQKQEQSFKEWNKLKYTSKSMRGATFKFMCQMDVFYSTN